VKLNEQSKNKVGKKRKLKGDDSNEGEGEVSLLFSSFF
jgi:DNA excision repair protein ERCC-4